MLVHVASYFNLRQNIKYHQMVHRYEKMPHMDGIYIYIIYTVYILYYIVLYYIILYFIINIYT